MIEFSGFSHFSKSFETYNRKDLLYVFDAFAKPEQIDIKSAAMNFSSRWTPFVPNKLLRQEVDRRGVVDFLSLPAIIFPQADSQNSNSSPLNSRLTITAIRSLLPGFQLALYSWLCTKVKWFWFWLGPSSTPY